ncbi:FEKKY domain-containing protein [Gelatiniphilus marinus]|uniref:Uncharacterized protein n=1 Tax=Gelatiniphilus marinus TaxID=1759464 RepID=A0ABW5JYE9_9FLAO
MTRRKKIKIGIGIIFTGIVFWQFGFFTRFNYLTAKIDIIGDTPRYVTVGLPFENYGVPVLSLNEKYGFYEHFYGCTFSGPQIRGIKAYNTQIEKYLNKRNGNDWRKKYQAELDYMIKHNATE